MFTARPSTGRLPAGAAVYNGVSGVVVANEPAARIKTGGTCHAKAERQEDTGHD